MEEQELYELTENNGLDESDFSESINITSEMKSEFQNGKGDEE